MNALNTNGFDGGLSQYQQALNSWEQAQMQANYMPDVIGGFKGNNGFGVGSFGTDGGFNTCSGFGTGGWGNNGNNGFGSNTTDWSNNQTPTPWSYNEPQTTSTPWSTAVSTPTPWDNGVNYPQQMTTQTP